MVVTPQQVQATVNAIQAKYPAFNHQTNYSLNVSGVIASSTTNTTYTNATVTDPSGGTAVPTTISTANWWVVTDLNAVTSTDIQQDARVKFTKNGDNQLTITTPLLNNLSSNNTRPGLSSIMVFEPGSSMTVSQAPTSTAGTGPFTNTFSIDVAVLSSSFSNQFLV